MSLIENYPARLTSGYYRVRETWEDPSSQLGAYRLLSNAMAKADENPGYFVFSNEGEVIYPEPESGIEDENVEAEAAETDSGQPIDEKPEETQKDVSGDDDTEGGNTGGDTTGEDAIEPETPTDDSDTESSTQPSDTEEFPEAVEYESDGNETPVSYAVLKTLMNIRSGNSLEADAITTYRKGTIVEVLQVCDNGWLRIRCAESNLGFAYVNSADEYIYGIGKTVYTVSAKDNLWLIAEKQLGDGTRYPEIRQLNGLTCNVIHVGMALVLPEK